MVGVGKTSSRQSYVFSLQTLAERKTAQTQKESRVTFGHCAYGKLKPDTGPRHTYRKRLV